MGAEQAENSEKKDPVVARAEAALGRIERRSSERVADLKEDKTSLETERAELVKARDEALQKNTAQSLEEYGRLKKPIEKLTFKIDQLGLRIKRIEEKAGDKREDILQKVEKKAEDLDLRAKQIDLHDDAGDKKREEVVTLIGKLEAEVDPKNPNTTDARREEAVQELAKAKRQLERLEGADRQDEKEKRVQEMREFQTKEEAKDREQAEQTLDEELKQLPDAAPKKNEFKGMFSKMADNVKNKLIAMADKPRDPTDALGGTKFTVDKVWAQLMYSMSNREITWDQNLSQGRKDALADAGITFIHDDERNVSTIKFGRVPEGSEGVAPGAVAVLQEYFGDNWYLKFKSLKTTDTVADLEKNIAANPTSEDEKNYQRFVVEVKAKMEADHASADTPVLTWLAENGLPKKDAEETPDSGKPSLETNEKKPLTPDADAKALAESEDWAMTVGGTFLLGPVGETLIELKDGETADLKKVGDELRLTVHSGTVDYIYGGNSYEAFARQLKTAQTRKPEGAPPAAPTTGPAPTTESSAPTSNTEAAPTAEPVSAPPAATPTAPAEAAPVAAVRPSPREGEMVAPM